ncbi:SDR family oxidoreductase [Levilactobacillus brevis]|nr:SDR family oxidoreductase [Levilactobacillus brevis]
MTTYLIIGANRVGQLVARQLATESATVRLLHDGKETLPSDLATQVTELTGDLTQEATYTAALQDQPIIFSALTGMDVDLAFEALLIRK